MRSLLLLLFFSSLFTADVAAQKKKFFKIDPGEKVSEKIPREEMYCYPEFVTGKVYLRNNTYSVVKMNYNSLFAEMQFIDPKNDTLSLADEKMIKLIVINADSFFYKDGYLKLILDDGKVKLANKKIITFANRQKLGGFGEPSNGSIDTYNTISTQSFFKDLVAMEIITMVKDSLFYIGNSFDNFKVVNKKNLLEIYSHNQKYVKTYLKNNKVDFSNEEDLKKMIGYLNKIIPTMPL